MYFCAVKCLAKYPSRYGEDFYIKRQWNIGTYFSISPCILHIPYLLNI